MHASIEQLLKVRDGDLLDASIGQHVEHCAECRDRLAGLGQMRDTLRGLPQVSPPAGSWARLEARLDRPRRNPNGWLAGAVAAAALIGLALWTWGGDQTSRLADKQVASVPDRVANRAPDRAIPGEARPGPVNGPADAPELATLVSQSRQLEQLLRELNSSTPRVMTVGTAGTIAGLQDSIAYIDYGLSYDEGLDLAQSEQLWRQRVGLMNTLVQVRGAQLQQISN